MENSEDESDYEDGNNSEENNSSENNSEENNSREKTGGDSRRSFSSFPERSEGQTEKDSTTNYDYMKQLTLELMINKKHFKKVLENTDAVKFDEMKRHVSNVKRLSPKIMSMTKLILDNYLKFNFAEDYGNDVKDGFQHYVNACVDYIENIERIDQEANMRRYKETDVIFETLNEQTTYTPSNIRNCWGKIIKKLS
jgi:hypothetical protein